MLNGGIGLDFYNINLAEQAGTTLLIMNNVFRVQDLGVALEQTFGGGNGCLLLGNSVQPGAGLGIYLGPGTVGCSVVGGRPKTHVLDEGTNNLLVGVNSIGAGRGPEIGRVLRGR